jgi:hypothetical protein
VSKINPASNQKLIEITLDLIVLKALVEDAQKLGKDFYSFLLGIQSFIVILPRYIILEVKYPGFTITFRRDEE